mgnify:CR=1 FL=1
MQIFIPFVIFIGIIMLFFAINMLTLFPKNDTMYYVILHFAEEETLMEYIKVSKAAEK